MQKIALLLICLPLLLANSALIGCQQKPVAEPAPLGDYAVLEQLAEAYREVAEQYPLQPRQMTPALRRQFVEQVFQRAGYDYTATLGAMARQGVDVTNQDHRDLAQLVLLPHQGLDHEARVELYSSGELASVEAIEAALR